MTAAMVAAGVDAGRAVERRILLGRVIRAHRLHFGLSQQELAERAGTSRHTVVRIEAGAVAASVDVVFRLATALQLHPSTLLADQVPVLAVARGGIR